MTILPDQPVDTDLVWEPPWDKDRPLDRFPDDMLHSVT